MACVERDLDNLSGFWDTESGDRIIYGVISYLNSSWERKSFYEFTNSS